MEPGREALEQISKGRTAAALDLLVAQDYEYDLQREFLAIKAKLANVKRDHQQGLMLTEQYQVEINRINRNMITLLTRGAEDPAAAYDKFLIKKAYHYNLLKTWLARIGLERHTGLLFANGISYANIFQLEASDLRDIDRLNIGEKRTISNQVKRDNTQRSLFGLGSLLCLLVVLLGMNTSFFRQTPDIRSHYLETLGMEQAGQLTLSVGEQRALSAISTAEERGGSLFSNENGWLGATLFAIVTLWLIRNNPFIKCYVRRDPEAFNSPEDSWTWLGNYYFRLIRYEGLAGLTYLLGGGLLIFGLVTLLMVGYSFYTLTIVADGKIDVQSAYFTPWFWLAFGSIALYIVGSFFYFVLPYLKNYGLAFLRDIPRLVVKWGAA